MTALPVSPAVAVTVDRHYVNNGHGWDLALRRTRPRGVRVQARPVLLVPGYGMNSFIFGHHPDGPSLEATIAAQGLEVWSVDLRGQGETRARTTRPKSYGLAELALEDVKSAVQGVLARTRTGHTKLDLVGCSLGAALSFTYLAHHEDAPVHAVVSLAGVVTWRRIHPFVRTLLFSPELAGSVPVRGTRRVARAALPHLARLAPRALALYINGKSTNIGAPEILTRTVEDPSQRLTREIARWVKARELTVRGINVSRALRRMHYPFLGVVAAHDGIVPPETSSLIFESLGSRKKTIRTVGSFAVPVGHADLFLFKHAHDEVYDPVAEFLKSV